MGWKVFSFCTFVLDVAMFAAWTGFFFSDEGKWLPARPAAEPVPPDIALLIMAFIGVNLVAAYRAYAVVALARTEGGVDG